MTPEQALSVLAQATEPNVRLTRADYVLINQALGVLEELIKKPLIQMNVEEKVVGGG